MKSGIAKFIPSLFWLFISMLPADAGDTIPAEAFQRIEAYAEQARAWSGTPGLSLAVTSSEGLLYAGTLGYADLKRKQPVKESTLFQIGSNSKSFTALALLALAEEGKLDLHEPIKNVLPWFSVQSDFADITPHHLLTQTGGIPTNRDDFPSTPFMAVALREQSSAWAPGTRFQYSNIGYQVLSVLVETVEQKPWAAIIRERILDPLDMTGTEPDITYAIRDRQAIGYIQADGDLPAHRTYALAEAPFFEYSMGDGCVDATAIDMATYLRMWLNQGKADETTIVSSEIFDTFIQPEIMDENGSGYGCGVEVNRSDGRFILTHIGGMVGHISCITADMDAGFGVAILANGHGQIQEIANYAIEVMRAASSGLPLPEVPHNPDPLLVENAGDFAGTFQSPDGDGLKFVAKDNSLWVENVDGLIQLERSGKDSFYSLHPSLDRYFLHFERNDDGQVVGVTHGPRWFTNQKYKRSLEFTIPENWPAYTGKYHSPSPWFPGFTVFIRKGELWCSTAGGGETSAGMELRLHPIGESSFRPAPEPTPERVIFDENIDGKAWRASWSGHLFYRARIFE